MYNASDVQAPVAVALSVLKRENYDQVSLVPDTPYVLIVDDDEAIISVLMFLLETEQHAGVGLSDSQKVLPFLEQVGTEHLPAAILLDLMMPHLSGYEIAAQLSQSERYAHLPIIIMTADTRVRSAGAVPGAIDWVGKPFHLDDLLSKLERYLAS